MRSERQQLGPETPAPRTRRWRGWIGLALVAAALTIGETWRGVHQRPTRHAPRAGDETPASTDPAFTRTLQLLLGMQIEPGNTVELLLDGNGTYAPLWRDLHGARRTIAVQMYYAKPGSVSDSLAAILCERARAGVRSLLLLDAFGSQAMSRRWLDGMRGCGVEVALLRQLQWHTLHSATDRSHVRAVVIDGRVGYTGGFGLADYWLGDGHHDQQWRESNVRFEGPAVAALQAMFSAGWAEATGELIDGEPFLPLATTRLPAETTGALAGVLFSAPSTGNTAAERFLSIAIQSACSRLHITNSYFVPSADQRRMLDDAAARGVDVRILTAGAKTDVKTPWLAGRSYYDELRQHGVRVFEYAPTMMHAKTIVVDGVWATVGSMNFDSHSLAFNDESNLIVVDRRFAARMDSVFVDDLRYATEMTPERLRARPWWERLLEDGAVLLARIL
ncbi:MAG: phospholipase D-like domain-containing protein [Gemmatimonadaceae bacterium]